MFVNPGLNTSETVEVVARTSADQVGRYVFRSNALDEMTRAAAIASRTVRLQAAEGRDMAFTGDSAHLVLVARSPMAADTPHYSRGDRKVHLRGTVYDAAGTGVVFPSSASLKDVWSHEVGHAIQDGFNSRVGNVSFLDSLSYGWSFMDALGNPRTAADAPFIPRECHCDQVQTEYSTLHCLQSYENINAAQTEGFASAFGKRYYLT